MSTDYYITCTKCQKKTFAYSRSASTGFGFVNASHFLEFVSKHSHCQKGDLNLMSYENYAQEEMEWEDFGDFESTEQERK